MLSKTKDENDYLLNSVPVLCVDKESGMLVASRTTQAIFLVNPAVITSPYSYIETINFLRGLQAIGRVNLPDDREVILLDSQTTSDEADFWKDHGAEVYELEKADNIKLKKVYRKYEDEWTEELSWTGDVPNLEQYIYRKAFISLRNMMTNEFCAGIFDTRKDNGDMIMFDAQNVKQFFCSMGMGKIDTEDIEDIFDKAPSHDIDKYDELHLSWEVPDHIANATRKAHDIISLWSYQTKQNSIRIAFRDEVINDENISEVMTRVGHMLNMEILLDAYASGVPVDDIIA